MARISWVFTNCNYSNLLLLFDKFIASDKHFEHLIFINSFVMLDTIAICLLRQWCTIHYRLINYLIMIPLTASGDKYFTSKIEPNRIMTPHIQPVKLVKIYLGIFGRIFPCRILIMIILHFIVYWLNWIFQ